MKKNLLLISIAVMTFSACGVKDLSSEKVLTLPADAVRFSAYNQSVTRVAVADADSAFYLSWEDADAVGIYGRGGCEGNNISFTAVPDEENKAKAKFFPTESGYYLPCSSEAEQFYAYLPFSGAAGDDPSAVVVSLDSIQHQAAANDVKHLSSLYIMKASPVQTDGKSEAVFSFKGLCSIVEFKLSSSGKDIPLTSIKLVDANANLACSSATIDLTSANSSLVAVNGSHSAELKFDSEVKLNATAKKAYLVVAPGAHAANALKAVALAADGTSCSVDLPAVTFEAGCSYVKELVLDPNNFVFADELAVTVSDSTVTAGTPVTFSFSGDADRIGFWSGEAPHRYEFKDAGEVVYKDVYLSFKTSVKNGAQPNCLKVKISQDYTGGKTEADINKATWKDISNLCVFHTDVTNTSSPVNVDDTEHSAYSGYVNISDSIKGTKPFYVATFYHVQAYNKASLGRTQACVFAMKADQVYDNDTTNLYYMPRDSMNYFPGQSYLEEPGKTQSGTKVPKWMAAYSGVYFDGKFNGTTVDLDAYAVTPAITRDSVILASDAAEIIKETVEPIPASHQYTFTKAGTYHVVFEGIFDTFYGESKKVTSFNIVVTEQ